MEFEFIFTEDRPGNNVKTFEDYTNTDFDPFGHTKKEVPTPVKTDEIDPLKDCVLEFSHSNSKLKFPMLSLPAGYSCPSAGACKSIANRHGEEFKSNGKKIQDFGDFRCYSAQGEAQYTGARNLRWRNYDLMRACKGNVALMTKIIIRSINHYISDNGAFSLFRIHSDGDFFSQSYFDAWLGAVKQFPNITFYAYTKSLPFWLQRKDSIPANLKLIASYGGKFDHLIEENNLRNAVVCDTVEDAIRLKRRIDVDDSIAWGSDENFALLLHGAQKAGTQKAKQIVKNAKILRDAKERLKKSKEEDNQL